MINNQDTITKVITNNKFDLEDRTLKFSSQVIRLIKPLPRTVTNKTLVPQLLRSSTSVGANYREANDALGKKDFIMRMKISRKEAKETLYWLTLLQESNNIKDLDLLINECQELIKIFSSVIKRSVDKKIGY